MHKKVPICVAPTALALALLAGAAQAQASAPPAPVVEVAKADLAPIAPRRWVPGSIVSSDDAKLATSAAGRVEYVAEVGTRLKTGERVAKLEDQAIRLHLEDTRSEVARIKAQRELAERQNERLEKLVASHSIAANQLDEAHAQVTQFAAQLRQAEVRVRSAQYDLDQTEVRAPFPGVVTERLAQRGEFVATGAAIAHLVDITHLEARVQAPLALAAMVHPGMELALRAGDKSLKARVRAVVPVGEEHSRQFELRIALSDTALLVGNAIEVSLPEREGAKTMAVPRDALVVRADGSYVVRVANDGGSERISVHAGASDGQLTAVEGLLNAGDLVVVRGAERLSPGQKVQIAAQGTLAVNTASVTPAKPPG
ncbi:MAG: efflux RND transporter periplasmic adaptor subunit [Dokdonella sp.]